MEYGIIAYIVFGLIDIILMYFHFKKERADDPYSYQIDNNKVIVEIIVYILGFLFWPIFFAIGIVQFIKLSCQKGN